MNEVHNQSEHNNWYESIYDQLRQIAAAQLARERNAQSIQPTMLVNDAYLKLVAQRNIDADDKSLVMAAAATIIRRLLVDHARRRNAQRRGGGKKQEISLQSPAFADAKQIEVLELHDALQNLEKSDARAARVVELRFFGGLTTSEIAQQLDISERTVQSDWTFAKAWLHRELNP